MKASRRAVILALALGAALLAGCVTMYQPHGATGGYKDRQVGENRYYVEFYGNGNTSRDTVFGYWLYRCAEITAQKGFDYFVMVSKTPPPGASLADSVVRASAASEQDDRGIVPARGGGGSYVYVPGGTITTWSSRGVIELKNGDPSSEDRPAFLAKQILNKLGPAVREASQTGKNLVFPKDLAESTREDSPPSGSGARGVKLDDLDSLLPKE